eukprot:CAMPEP_0194407140 /NCGR_PEP_ID=MMETSP0176-20130528/5178_1 /TAXON_ID=216777 /ORGANISM="Proboscia alata, Strain PI-D3" /LENGTH=436 /DNA_ID=CAMNT_0039206599 /DNA_START=108 /DNA_END=1418 /DNA_ORIENTATION=+
MVHQTYPLISQLPRTLITQSTNSNVRGCIPSNSPYLDRNCNSQGRQSDGSCTSSDRESGSSGANADDERSEDIKLGSSLSNRKRRSEVSSAEERMKQRRVDENQYVAATARTAVKNATRSAQHLMFRGSGIIGRKKFFNGAIDLTTVRHMHSNQFDSEKVDRKGEIDTDYGEEYRRLFNSCLPLYSCANKSTNTAQDGASVATSEISLRSRTSSKSAHRRFTKIPQPKKSIRPSNNYFECPKMKHSFIKQNESANSQNSSTISLDDAMSFSAKARIVVNAVSPFIIIHANASFFRFSDLQAQKVLGLPLETFMRDSKNKTLSLVSSNSLLEMKRGTNINLVMEELDQQRKMCCIDVIPVIADFPGCQNSNLSNTWKSQNETSSSETKHSPSSITHFMIDLTEEASKQQKTDVDHCIVDEKKESQESLLGGNIVAIG